MKDAKHLALGELGEDLGCRYLERKGFRILDRRYSNASGVRVGEIDIVAEYEGRIIFVEVKTRLARRNQLLLPEENITRAKLRRLEKIAWSYLREKRRTGKPYGFHALSILYDETEKKATIRHLQDIFF